MDFASRQSKVELRAISVELRKLGTNFQGLVKEIGEL